jgi:hypothetical protein
MKRQIYDLTIETKTQELTSGKLALTHNKFWKTEHQEIFIIISPRVVLIQDSARHRKNRICEIRMG